MSLLDYNMDVPDLEVVPAGEYLVRINSAEVREYNNEKGSGKFLFIGMQVADEPNAKPVFASIFLPDKTDDQRQHDDKIRRLKKFYECFNIDYQSGPVDPADLKGAEGYVYLKISPATEEYDEKNVVTRYLASN